MDDEFEDALETLLEYFPEYTIHEGRDHEPPDITADSLDSTTQTRQQAQSTSPIGMEAKEDPGSHIRRKLHSRIWGPRHVLLRDKVSFLLGCTMLW